MLLQVMNGYIDFNLFQKYNWVVITHDYVTESNKIIIPTDSIKQILRNHKASINKLRSNPALMQKKSVEVQFTFAFSKNW